MTSDSIHQFDFNLAAKIPPNIRFGTSSWTYPGWQGLIYKRTYKNQQQFKRECLAEYAEFPCFRTVGIDSTFYTAPIKQQLRDYAAVLPSDFKWISKIWERITIPKYPTHPRYGELKGQVNPDFLNPDITKNQVLHIYEDDQIQPNTGPFVFQFPTIAKSVLSAGQFFERLDSFFDQLPKHFRYAVEIRNPEYLSKEYFSVLNRHGVTHCFNHWDRMPALKDQMKSAATCGGITANFFVARLLTPLGVSYENAVKLFEPYEKVQQPNQEMREDAVRLAKRAVERNAEAFIIVNNRSEGNAPMTIEAIAKLLV